MGRGLPSVPLLKAAYSNVNKICAGSRWLVPRLTLHTGIVVTPGRVRPLPLLRHLSLCPPGPDALISARTGRDFHF